MMIYIISIHRVCWMFDVAMTLFFMWKAIGIRQSAFNFKIANVCQAYWVILWFFLFTKSIEWCKTLTIFVILNVFAFNVVFSVIGDEIGQMQWITKLKRGCSKATTCRLLFVIESVICFERCVRFYVIINVNNRVTKLNPRFLCLT
jgi:hypothetical protein